MGACACESSEGETHGLVTGFRKMQHSKKQRVEQPPSGPTSRATSLTTSPTPVQIPATMRACVWRGDSDPSKMAIETLKTPMPKANEVLIKVKACGVCHTDLHCIKGEVPFPKPACFGHEICGEVIMYGPEADPPPLLAGRTLPPVGAKVIAPFIMPCGRCSFCACGEEDTCEPFFRLNRGKGHLYDDTTRLFRPRQGGAGKCGECAEEEEEDEPIAMYSFAGMAEYAVVPNTAVFPLPDALVDAGLYAESCVLGCAFFTAYGALRNAAGLDVVSGPAGASKGKSACVIGCGGVGGSVLQLLKYAGLSPIIAVDVSDDALAQATALGATHVVKSSRECDAVEEIAKLTGGAKVDYCFEVIGLKQTFEQAVMAVRDGGTACFIGISDVRHKAEVPITHIVRRRISLVGSYGARASRDMPALLEIASKGGVDLKGGVTRRFALEDAGSAYKLLSERKCRRAIVTFE